MLLQMLEELPINLQGSILATVQAPLPHLLAVLPPRLHMLALHSANPSVAAHSSLQVSVRDALADDKSADDKLCRRCWELVGQLSSLQHLSIDLLRECSPSIPLPFPGPLSGLTSLTYLKVKSAKLPLVGAWVGYWPSDDAATPRFLTFSHRSSGFL